MIKNIFLCFKIIKSKTYFKQLFIDLAWYGLKSPVFTNTPLNIIFNQEYPFGSDKRIRFEKINNAEDKQESTYYLGILPKSIPCD